MSINNSPSAVGCLCGFTTLPELSVTGTGCSCHSSGWAFFDSHVNATQIHVTRYKAEDVGNHSNDVAGKRPSQVFKSSPIWSLCCLLQYPSFIYFVYFRSPPNKTLQYVHVRNYLLYNWFTNNCQVKKKSLNRYTFQCKCTLFKLCMINLRRFLLHCFHVLHRRWSRSPTYAMQSSKLKLWTLYSVIFLLVLVFHCCFEICIEIAKILQERTYI